MKNILIILLFLCFSCKDNAQNYDYEVEDSKTAYDMSSWSNDQKNDYYEKASNLIDEFFKRENFKSLNKTEFNKTVYNKLGIRIDTKRKYQLIPYSIFQKDSADGYDNQMIIFPDKRIISFTSELPLLNKSSLKLYSNPDELKRLNGGISYDLVLNKILFNENIKEIDYWLKQESLSDLFIDLVANYHFDDNEKIFRFVINKLQNEIDKNTYKIAYLQLLFYRDRKQIDKNFLLKIVKLDKDKKLYSHFKNIIISEFSKDEQLIFSKEINEIYGIDGSELSENNLTPNLNLLLSKNSSTPEKVVDNLIFTKDENNSLQINKEILDYISKNTTRENSGYLVALENYIVKYRYTYREVWGSENFSKILAYIFNTTYPLRKKYWADKFNEWYNGKPDDFLGDGSIWRDNDYYGLPKLEEYVNDFRKTYWGEPK